MEEPKVRYNDTDLLAFKTLIEEKIAKAQEELEFTRKQIAELSDTGFNQQNGDMYDDSGAHADLEFMTRMAARQFKFIEDLQKALLRIQNKTYGVCTVTGTLIPVERLRVVPHATKSVDGKNIANKNKVSPGLEPEGEAFPSEELARPAIKPVADQVRIATPRTKSTDDWELDNETMEDAGYRNLPSDEDDH